MKPIHPATSIVIIFLLIICADALLFSSSTPLSDASLQLLSEMEKKFPSVTAQVETLAAGVSLSLDYDKAITRLYQYISSSGSGVGDAFRLVLQSGFFLKEQMIASKTIRVDGKADDWTDISHRVTDDTGDSFQKRADMDIIACNAFCGNDGTLCAMIAFKKQPVIRERIDLLLDLSGDDGYDVQFVIYAWTDGKVYTSLYNLKTKKNIMAVCEYASAEALEIKIPLKDILPEKEGIVLLARSYDKDAVVIDSAPAIRLRVSLNNYPLFLLLSLLENNCFEKDDTISTAIALVNSYLFELGNTAVRKQIAEDIASHYAFYREIIEWQEAMGIPYGLKQAPVPAKILWADRSGGVLSEIRDSIKSMNTNGRLTLPIYNEFVDKIRTLKEIFRIVRENRLHTSSLSASARILENFVHTRRVYRSSIENLVDFNKRKIFSDDDLKKAKEEIKKGEYEISYFGKKRRWDDFRWLNYQYSLYEKKGEFRGDCGDTTVVQMGFFRAAGIAPISFQWIHPEGIAAYTHNFPGYYNPRLKRWYSVQKPFFYTPGGNTIDNIEVNFHFTKPAWHHWFYSSDMTIRRTGKKSEIFAPYYQGEPVNSNRLISFLTIGMSDAHLSKVFFSDTTMQKGFFFTDQTAPLKIADADDDTLPDDIEKELGLDPNSPDTDEDGFSDLWEVGNNHDPLVPASGDDTYIIAIDGITRDVGERENLLLLNDPADDSIARSKILDIKRLSAIIWGEYLYIVVDFYQNICLHREKIAHAFLISLKNREKEAYWVQWYDGYFSVSDARKTDSSQWKQLNRDNTPEGASEGAYEFTSLQQAEFLIPLSLFKTRGATYIQYFCGGYTDNKKTFNSCCDYTDQLRISLASDPLLDLVENTYGNSTSVSDVSGDTVKVKSAKDIKSLGVVYADKRLVCLVDFYHPEKPPFGIYSFSIQSKNRQLNYWAQWVSIIDPHVYIRPVNGTSKEDTTIVREDFSCFPFNDGYAFVFPRDFFAFSDILYISFFEGGYDTKKNFIYDADASAALRVSLGDDETAFLINRKPDESAFIIDPENDCKAARDFHDIKEFTASRFPEGILCSASFHHPITETLFGIHTIYIRDPAAKENWWIQWWNYGEFSYSFWKDGDEGKSRDKARSRFDIMRMDNTYYFFIPIEILTPAVNNRVMEIRYYTSGNDSGGKSLYDSDITELLTIEINGKSGGR